MSRKSEAHETLSVLLKRDGVPPEMIMDGSKEQTCGEFRRKLKEVVFDMSSNPSHNGEEYSIWRSKNFVLFHLSS